LANVGQINILIKEKVLKSEIGNEENKLDILMRFSLASRILVIAMTLILVFSELDLTEF
jgi:hypothetical protein